MESKWKPSCFIPALSGVEVLEGYHANGVKFDKDVFHSDIRVTFTKVDEIINAMMVRK